MSLTRLLVVGGGITGWSTAAAIKRRVPKLAVTILPLAPPPDALADRIATTLPSVLGFHADLGIGLDDAVVRTGSLYRLGTRFEGWVEGALDYVHAYARHGEGIGGAAFQHLWARAALSGDAPPFDSLSPAAAMARAGRFVLPGGDGPLADYGFGLTLDIPRYTAMLMAFARHVGVEGHLGQLAGVEHDAQGGIAGLVLDDGTRLAADLYCDCTGPNARLHGTLGVGREDWKRWLPGDRLVLEAAPIADPLPMERVVATENGWRWIGPTQQGALYSAAHGTVPGEPIPIAAGASLEPWRHNVVAIGDAAVAIEPLEWSNLHLAHSAIDRLITMLPAGAPHPLEAAEYNRQALAEARRVRDFVLLHYATARRDTPFWHDVAGADLPDSLAHTLRLFRERGRLPFYEEETFDRDSWLAVLFGQAVLPRRIDPLADSVPPAEAMRAIAQRHAAIAQAVQPLPTLAAFRAAQSRHLHERA
ncbi:tryptophan 7-halogenase [Sphingomonas pokkalii]|uniref:Tryptophan halogenase n=1 Tax=Sphingomonas pokkalii TaxID=2175090 RepID=A0A2U0SJI0_9SPHN|nr:tryptophan 7-halogenase [Sphingomonas pokkalii]PVX31506.1 tryptophan halogenase [Sphingomonas pokkalii]